MAKKRRYSKKNKTVKSGFHLDVEKKFEILAVILIILGILLLIAGFGLGGSLPTGTFDILRFLFGYGAYFVPVALLFIAFSIFKSEDRKVSIVSLIGISVIMFCVSTMLHINYIGLNSLSFAENGDGGGYYGYISTELLVNLLEKPAIIVVLIGLFFVGLIMALNISLKDIFDRIRQYLIDRKESKLLKKESKENGLEVIKSINTKHEPILNSNVPLENSSTGSSFKNSVQKLSKNENHEALTTSADPDWNFPDVKLLSNQQEKADAGDWKKNAEIIRQTLADFKIPVEMGEINVGPRVTQYTLVPDSGVRLTKITALEQNIALNLAATSIRIEAPIPGKRAVGIEVPNQKSANVRLRSILESDAWSKSRSALTFALGQDISGHPTVAELEKMPHLLIAGATGSGKSVMINIFLASLLYKNSPNDMKLILVDPKQVELTPYNDLPHLLTPVITEPEKCISALKWAVAEMERRYTTLAEIGKKNIEDYNKLKNQDNMPYIVIVIDELADLMMLAARDVEALIVRLAQKARAVGIHLTLATQRPSVDVITGLIKANIPARIAFTVTSQVDSRTILDQAGAEKLLGQGDMLYSSPSLPKPIRLQGAYVSESELNDISDHIRLERAPNYNEDIVNQPVQIGKSGGMVPDADASDDSMYRDAVQVVAEAGKASASMLQRRLRVGYARAARMIETMEEQGIVGPADGARPREVLIRSLDDISTEEDV